MITDVTSKVNRPATADRTRESNQSEAVPLPAVRQDPWGSQPSTPPSESPTLQTAVEAVRQVMQESSSRLQIEFDPDSQRVIVKVLSGESGEVIRQIPAEEVLDLAKHLLARKGLLLEQRA
ncbi:MAG: flagellar protein FlaG [Nitrospiraceae bacterium]|nr:flagellar protein FlaG [Nitrospiraceae bacterium]